MREAVDRRRTILRELALAVTAGAVFTVSPFTPNELAPSLAGGVVVGGGIFAWRLRRASPVWREPVAARGMALHTLPVFAAGLLCLLAFTPTLVWMYGEWTRSVWVNDHGLLMPFLMAWLVRDALRDDDEPAAASAWGFVPLGAGLALAVIDANAQTRYLSALGLLLVLPGLSLLLLGPSRTRALRAPLLLGLMLVPIPFTLATPLALRSLTTSGVVPLLEALGITVLREGTLIQLPQGQTFVIADACSGMASLTASVAVSLYLVATASSRWRKIAILLAAAPLAIAANVVRVTLLVLLCRMFGNWLLDTPLHEASGVAVFALVVVALLGIAHTPRAKLAPSP